MFIDLRIIYIHNHTHTEISVSLSYSIKFYYKKVCLRRLCRLLRKFVRGDNGGGSRGEVGGSRLSTTVENMDEECTNVSQNATPSPSSQLVGQQDSEKDKNASNMDATSTLETTPDQNVSSTSALLSTQTTNGKCAATSASNGSALATTDITNSLQIMKNDKKMNDGLAANPLRTKSFICGVIEGFYGRPWTTEQRKDLFRKQVLFQKKILKIKVVDANSSIIT